MILNVALEIVTNKVDSIHVENQEQESQENTETMFQSKEKFGSISTLILIFVTAIIFGVGGYFLGNKVVEVELVNSDEVAVISSEEVDAVIAAPDQICEDIEGLDGYQFCTDETKYWSDYIIRTDAVRIDHVDSYSVSPNKQWIFVIRNSNEFAKEGGAPAENALSMVNIQSGKITELFSQIYFPNFNEDSWSPNGNGIVFTAGGSSTPDILGETNMYAVVYCTIECKVLARDAGPLGIGGDPAFFIDGKIQYTDVNDETITITQKF